jgi:hypothetical protein
MYIVDITYYVNYFTYTIVRDSLGLSYVKRVEKEDCEDSVWTSN